MSGSCNVGNETMPPSQVYGRAATLPSACKRSLCSTVWSPSCQAPSNPPKLPGTSVVCWETSRPLQRRDNLCLTLACNYVCSNIGFAAFAPVNRGRLLCVVLPPASHAHALVSCQVVAKKAAPKAAPKKAAPKPAPKKAAAPPKAQGNINNLPKAL